VATQYLKKQNRVEVLTLPGTPPAKSKLSTLPAAAPGKGAN
jgi:hypothetical protein